VLVRRLWLTDFRNYDDAVFEFTTGRTAIVGANGQGKTNLVEALAFLATLASFRDAPTDALVRDGAGHAVVRAEVVHDDGRELLVEAELTRGGRTRVQVNKQRLVRSRDLLGVVRVTVFSPDDLVLVKGGPAERRRYLDDVLVALHARNDRARVDLERILRQRNTLLKQAGGRLTEEIAWSLDVWDAKLAEVGDKIGAARAELVTEMGPMVADAYAAIARHGRSTISVRYEPPWRSAGLAAALSAGRSDDVRRQVSLIGPHRDELELTIGAAAARTHASQGEQRTLALALRLAAHRVVASHTGSPPLLLLDDVFSELDHDRSAALIEALPAAQVVLTTAGVLPDGAAPDRVIHLERETV
jgi:DNA replication and repair protein RecF